MASLQELAALEAEAEAQALQEQQRRSAPAAGGGGAPAAGRAAGGGHFKSCTLFSGLQRPLASGLEGLRSVQLLRIGCSM